MDDSLKRFTDTGKWNDPWFRSLSPTTKLLWSWLVDHCDNTGVIEPDIPLASFQIGSEVKESHLAELGDRLQRLPNNKFWIPKFIKFQFGNLTDKSVVHRSVIRLIQSNSLEYPIPCLSDVNDMTMSEPSTKEKDKDKETNIYGLMEPRLCKMFVRKSITAYSEQSALSEISRRPEAIKELEEIESFHGKPENYFPQSLQKLLSTWQETLDRARTHEKRKENNGHNSKLNSQSVDRSIGTCNEGAAKNYRGIIGRDANGKLVKVSDPQRPNP